jgi:hypothetical protein
MARAISASGLANPKARRVRRRILVFVDSTRPWERPCSRAASMARRWRRILRPSAGVGGDAAALRPGEPAVERLAAGPAPQHEDVPKALFQQTVAPEAGIGLGDPGQLLPLALGEVLGVLPEDVTGPGQRPRPLVARAGRGVRRGPAHPPARLGPGQCPGLVPGLAAHLVEGVGGPGHDVERVGAADGAGAAAGDDPCDPVGRVGRHVGDRRGGARGRGGRRSAPACPRRAPRPPTRADRCRGRRRP